jgi:hypothetical protein
VSDERRHNYVGAQGLRARAGHSTVKIKRAVLAVVVALLVLRSFVFPATAPTWLRGTSPFNWLATRAERQHCMAFATMMGSQNMGYAIYGDRDGPVEVRIDRTLRVQDSLVFEGKAARGGRVRLLFHCATASVRGRPGEHQTAASVPWPGKAEDWAAAHRLEERMERQCADSAAVVFPTRRIAKQMLILRPLPNRANIRGTAIDTVNHAEPLDFGCEVWVFEPRSAPYRQFGEFSVHLSLPTRDNLRP